jgi:adenylyltransferase/sulfurtransferase
VEAAAEALAAASPELRIEAHPYRILPGNVDAALAGVDAVIDGTDRFEVRVQVADACARAGIPLISASVQGFDGQVVLLRPYLGPPHPSYRCIYPDDPQPGALPSCALSGVLGPVPGTVAGLAATEVIKLLLAPREAGPPGPLICYDALSGSLHRIEIPRTAAANSAPGATAATPAYVAG